MTWGDSHWGAVQLQSNSRLPGRHSKAHFSHKHWEKRTSIRPLFFLGILTHIHIWIKSLSRFCEYIEFLKSLFCINESLCQHDKVLQKKWIVWNIPWICRLSTISPAKSNSLICRLILSSYPEIPTLQSKNYLGLILSLFNSFHSPHFSSHAVFIDVQLLWIWFPKNILQL